MTIYQFMSKFPTEESAISHFYQIRYNGILTCPHCSSTDKVYRCHNRLKACRCKNCDNMFSPFKGTIFEKTTTPLWKWFYAIHLFLNARKGFSALQLQRELGVTYKTAWRMFHQIRTAMQNEDECKSFSIMVEIDETYVGGKPRKYTPKLYDPATYDESVKLTTGRGTRKTPVVGIKERASGHIYAQVMLPDDKGKKLTGKQLLAIIEKVCIEGTTVISDDFSGYRILDKPDFTKILDGLSPTPRFGHHTVCHSRRKWSAGPGIHTNGIESFWALLKRGYHGTYHSMSVKYMQRYIDEFCFRQNTRKLPSLEVFDLLLKHCVLKKPS